MSRTSAQSLVLASLVLALAAPVAVQPVNGQTGAAGKDPSSALPDPAPSPFLIEPDAEIQGNQIKQQTYRSQAAGQNGNWNLDIGRFQAPIREDPNQLADDLTDSNFSGMRLRLPFRGRTGN